MGMKDFSLATGGTPSNAMVSPAPALLTPVSDTRPHKLIIDPLPISRIPVAMRRVGWNVSAALMERWFSSPAKEMQGDEKNDARLVDRRHISEDIVTMAWALEFERCAAKLKVLENRWDVAPASHELLNRLRENGWDERTDFELGNTAMRASDLDRACNINAIGVGSLRDTLDDLYGALGVATLKMAVTGRAFVSPSTGRRTFCIRSCGFYLKDYYDFNGTQYLGLWTENGVLGKAATVVDTVLSGLPSTGMVYHWRRGSVGHVFNHHFRAFRDLHEKGGDFLVYSDVLWHPLADAYIDLEAAISRASVV